MLFLIFGGKKKAFGGCYSLVGDKGKNKRKIREKGDVYCVTLKAWQMHPNLAI